MEVLPHAVAANRDGPVVDHGLPEESRRVSPGLIVAGYLGHALVADNLRNLGVGVQAVQRIFAPQQRLQDGLVRKAPGQRPSIFCRR